jgi:hypothetical protein
VIDLPPFQCGGNVAGGVTEGRIFRPAPIGPAALNSGNQEFLPMKAFFPSHPPQKTV